MRSVLPFKLEEDLDSDMKEKIVKRMEPLCYILYLKGEYYVYQAESLLKEPGLSSNLGQKTQMDRYFVTNQIKSIAQKASVAAVHAKIPEIERALEDPEHQHLKRLRHKMPELDSEDEEEE